MHHPSAYRIRLEPMRRERKGRGGQHWYVVRDPYSCVLNSKLAKWTLESLSLRVSWSVSTQSFTSHLTPNRRRCVWGESVLFPNARGVRAFYISQYITRMHKTPSSVLNMKSYRFKIRLVERKLGFRSMKPLTAESEGLVFQTHSGSQLTRLLFMWNINSQRQGHIELTYLNVA